MNVETQRKNIVHRILDVQNSKLLSQIEELWAMLKDDHAIKENYDYKIKNH